MGWKDEQDRGSLSFLSYTVMRAVCIESGRTQFLQKILPHWHEDGAELGPKSFVELSGESIWALGLIRWHGGNCLQDLLGSEGGVEIFLVGL